ncbi:putative baseplate assembly protein [Granulicella sibirica]|uniref:Baseplate protein J-like domain-containing protein n=1 Tax=Granulicella sibirica TaxID=2479048 RepID=A0A4V1L5P8_9BACT|nr:putative baseplate assembly protein [Granulicella sibirica]RXH56514.1 hypothetical protein GRAN_3371 [Granulicella sibirica]
MQTLDRMCSDQNRLEDVRKAALLGLDYVELGESQTTLYVYFLGKAPEKIERANVVITGGSRIIGIVVTSLRVVRQKDPTLDDHLELRVDKAGDFSTYTLRCVALDESGMPTETPMQGFDRFYASVSFSFKSDCPTTLDCRTQPCCPAETNDGPEANYLAKDYESFRQLILDRLALIMPEWQETHAADLGVTLVELLAYAGDSLSYFQDAVATEAYLGTARERISVRRHARLVDYRMHEGCNSRAWITIGTSIDQPLDLSAIYFITAYPGSPANSILAPADLVNVPATEYEVFRAITTTETSQITIFASHSKISLYTWGDCRCCLSKGSTSATLVDGWVQPAASNPPAGNIGAATYEHGPDNAKAGDAPPSDTGGPSRVLQLKAGDVLIFEEVLGPHTGNPADADPKHRQAVRLTKVTQSVDKLYSSAGQSDQQPAGQPVLEIEWDSEDALTFPLCLSSRQPAPDCSCMEDVSVARGNVVLVDYGQTVSETIGIVPTASSAPTCSDCCTPASITITAGQFAPTLTREPLTSRQPIEVTCSAAGMVVQDPRTALPCISLSEIPAGPLFTATDAQPLFTFDDFALPFGLAKALKDKTNAAAQSLRGKLSKATQQQIAAWDGSEPLPSTLQIALLGDLTTLTRTWSPAIDLLESGPDDQSFVVETDNDGYGHLRFGDGVLGMSPEAGSEFKASYRIGNGTHSNVGAESIRYIVFEQETLSGVTLTPRNPLAATGGVDPEPIEEVKKFTPYSFGNVLERAITADDYAAIAKDNARRLAIRDTLIPADPSICTSRFRRLQNAKAVLRWTGSWYTATVALDPEEEEGADTSLTEEVKLYLEPFRRMGYDLQVNAAQYVPLKVTICVCVLPNYFRGHVETAVRAALGSSKPCGGSEGLFSPDRLTFGQGIYISQLIAAVQAVPGVLSVKVTELERLSSAEMFSGPAKSEVPANSVFKLGPLEIARLDNDPNTPENGVLVLDMRGGR